MVMKLNTQINKHRNEMEHQAERKTACHAEATSHQPHHAVRQRRIGHVWESQPTERDAGP